MRFWALPLMLCAAAPVAAQDSSLRERLEALASRPPVVLADPFADEIQADLARIKAEEIALFGAPPDLGAKGAPILIALFVSDDCPECPGAVQDLDGLVQRLGFGARLFNVSQIPEAAQVLARLTLDTTPSYVMHDRLIRGQMPTFVLERYLTKTAQNHAPAGE